jgi:UDP-N-acetylmuramate--alanine ligase
MAMRGLVDPVDPIPLSELGRPHFAGIGGAGMSAVARILLARGIPVSGCDRAATAELDELARLGARIYTGHSADHLDGVDTLVYSTALKKDNPELVEAERRGMPVLHRATALAAVMMDRQAIAVAGTHGKTTTTSMITTILRRCGVDPSYAIGGILAETGLGAADGTGKVFVAEADESDGSILMLAPDVAVLTCVEADHLENYGSLERIERTFAEFLPRISADGMLVTSSDDPGVRQVLAAASRAAAGGARMPRVVTYGDSPDADYRLAAVTPAGMATEFELTSSRPAALRAAAGAGSGAGAGQPGPAAIKLRIEVPGRHNALNAAAAYATTIELGYPHDDVAAGLAAYRGARRRMEFKGEADGVRVLDSYAHHPTELAADLAAARDIAAGGRVIAIFQPHLFSRTRIFAERFGAVLGEADEVFVLDVYAAREDPEPGVTGALIADAVPGRRAVFCPDRHRVPAAIADIAKPGDLVLTMGAGDVTELGPVIVDALAGRAGDGG